MEGKFAAIIDALASNGWIIIPDFLPKNYLKNLAEEASSAWESGDFSRAGVGQGDQLKVRTEIRSDFIHWLEPENLTALQREYWQLLDDLRLEINRHLYLGLWSFEGHFAVYPAGSFYKKHIDQFQTTRHRMVSCLLYLNENWQPEDGGQLRIFYPGSEERFIEVLPTFGTFVCFRSDTIVHEVLPAKRERFSLTGWLRKDII